MTFEDFAESIVAGFGPQAAHVVGHIVGVAWRAAAIRIAVWVFMRVR